MVELGAPEWVVKLLPGKRIVSCNVDAEGNEAVVEYNDERVGPNRTQRVVLKKPQVPDEVGDKIKGQTKVVADSTKQVDSQQVEDKEPVVPEDKKEDHPDKKKQDAKHEKKK